MLFIQIIPELCISHWFQYHNPYFGHVTVRENGKRQTKMGSCLGGLQRVPLYTNQDSKVHGANMGPYWVLSAPDGTHVGPMNLAIREVTASISRTADPFLYLIPVLIFMVDTFINRNIMESSCKTSDIKWILMIKNRNIATGPSTCHTRVSYCSTCVHSNYFKTSPF